MNSAVRDALENACESTREPRGFADSARKKALLSVGALRAIILNVLQDLPPGMTLEELRDELEIANNQEAHS